MALDLQHSNLSNQSPSQSLCRIFNTDVDPESRARELKHRVVQTLEDVVREKRESIFQLPYLGLWECLGFQTKQTVSGAKTYY